MSAAKAAPVVDASGDATTIEALGDAGLLVRFGASIDLATQQRVHALAHALRAVAPRWVTDIVPAYASLALHFAPAALAASLDPFDEASILVRTALALALAPASSAAPARTVEIGVHYGGDDGPDLAALAVHARMTIDEVVRLHAAADYRVAMLGFAPGFPYLIGLDPALAMPRLAQPRMHVAAGSVAIGGAQAGIYPRPGPGGWRVIGRTDCALFDPQRDPPSLLLPGDRVRFVAQSASA